MKDGTPRIDGSKNVKYRAVMNILLPQKVAKY